MLLLNGDSPVPMAVLLDGKRTVDVVASDLGDFLVPSVAVVLLDAQKTFWRESCSRVRQPSPACEKFSAPEPLGFLELRDWSTALTLYRAWSSAAALWAKDWVRAGLLGIFASDVWPRLAAICPGADAKPAGGDPRLAAVCPGADTKPAIDGPGLAVICPGADTKPADSEEASICTSAATISCVGLPVSDSSFNM